MPDDNGKGLLELWRVHNRELVLVREDMRGMFFDKNCYIIKYTPQQKKSGVVYFWQGKHASILDKGASALQTVDVASKMTGGAIQVLVNQGCEPRHFLKIFKGKFIILFGNHEEFVKNKDAKTKPTEIQLYKIRGTTEDNVHAEQLPPLASSLASDDTFILTTPASTYVWNGVVCSNYLLWYVHFDIEFLQFRVLLISKRKWLRKALNVCRQIVIQIFCKRVSNRRNSGKHLVVKATTTKIWINQALRSWILVYSIAKF